MLSFLRSFCTLNGRLNRRGYWYRQILLALLLLPCGNIATTFADHLIGGHGNIILMGPPLLLLQFSPLSLLTFLGGGSLESSLPLISRESLEGLEETIPTLGQLLMLLAGGLAILPTWCAASLTLRRLRDTRLSPACLLLCLPMLWLIPLGTVVELIAEFTPAGSGTCDLELILNLILCIPLLLGTFFTSLPSRPQSARPELPPLPH